MGELFGRDLHDEDDEDGGGEGHRPPRFDLDLDSGTARLHGTKRPDKHEDTQ